MEYSVIPLHIGMEKPLRCLHIADTHLLFADGRDNAAKYNIAIRRYGEYVYTNIGRNVPYFLDALLYTRDHCDLMLHCGDLIDFVSLQNLEVAQKLFDLAGIDYFMCAGNHEYTHYSGQHPETPEEAEAGRHLVPHYFRNNLYFDSRQIHGLNLIAIDNSSYRFTADQRERFEREVERGMPMILLIHNPIYTPALADYRFDNEGKGSLALIGCPPDAPERHRKFDTCPPDETTLDFIARLKREPLLKAVLAGHVHFHQNYAEEIAPGLRQFVVGGGYYGCGEVFEIS